MTAATEVLLVMFSPRNAVSKFCCVDVMSENPCDDRCLNIGLMLGQCCGELVISVFVGQHIVDVHAGRTIGDFSADRIAG